MNTICTPRILDRALGTVLGDLARWRALEDTLVAFTARVREARVDEGDEAGATRAYVRMLAEAGLLRWMVPAAQGGAMERLMSTPICIIRQWLARESGALDNAFVMQGLGSNPVTMAGSEARAAVLAGVRDARAVLQTQDDALVTAAIEAFAAVLRPLPGELAAIAVAPVVGRLQPVYAAPPKRVVMTEQDLPDADEQG